MGNSRGNHCLYLLHLLNINRNILDYWNVIHSPTCVCTVSTENVDRTCGLPKWKCHKSNPPRMGNHLQKHVGIEPTKVWKVDQANMRYKRIKNGDLNRFNMISSLTNNKLMWIYQIKHQQILGNLRVSNVECHMIGGADGFHCNRCKETRSTQPRGWPPALWPSKFRDEFHSSCGDTGYTSS